MTKYSFVFLAILFISIVSCGKDDEAAKVDCTGLTPTYNSDIAAIFNASCATVGCHMGPFPADGLDLSKYATAKSASLNGKVLQSIKHESGVKAMPQDQGAGLIKLPAADIKKVECWIQNGAPE